MKKRGQSEVLEITLLFEFVAGVLIVWILIYGLGAINDTSAVSGAYLNQDYQIINNILAGKPGNYEVTYATGIFVFKEGEFKKSDEIKLKGDLAVKITKENGEIRAETTKNEKRGV